MASVGFRWLDILEKEFDKSFVDLDIALGDIEGEEAGIVFNARQKLCTLGSCFAQLSHKAQTIFQNSAKVEAELIHLRAELIDSKTKKELLENELHNLLLQLHSTQLSQLPDSLGNKKLDQHFKPDVNAIKRRLEAEIRQSPMRLRRSASIDTTKTTKDNHNHTSAQPHPPPPFLDQTIRQKVENAQLFAENAALRNDVLALTAEVYGAKLAAKYLDKELAGRIQQLQLLGKEMRGELRDKLWSQLESEILLQRHKTVVRACRRNQKKNNSLEVKLPPLPPPPEPPNNGTDQFGDVRVVVVKRKPEQGLGISITGGREHGVPILISELEPNGPAALSEQLYIGDAILSVNDVDLRSACHKEAVAILQQQTGDCVLEVQYVAADDSDNSLEEDGLNFRFFNDEVCNLSASSHSKGSREVINTPTAPRTPESNSISRLSRTSIENIRSHPLSELDNIKEPPPSITTNINNNNTLPDNITKFSDHLSNVDTNELVLLDNATNNIIKLENFKKVDVFSTMESDNGNFNCSANSLVSDNLSSPMQTSTDVYLDSEVASNDSNSPKNLVKVEVDIKSDQSLLNSDESADDSSPKHRKPKKTRKKYFGVKTLQSIFSKHDGYSDISTTASEIGEEPSPLTAKLPSTTPQFEEQVHNIISDILTRSQLTAAATAKYPSVPNTSSSSSTTATTKKYFSLHGQNLRVSKALRLCPNEEVNEIVDQEQRKEKLLARYVYNANSLNVDGVGDPDFGTPV